jgi:two-component sensor histidine kinase
MIGRVMKGWHAIWRSGLRPRSPGALLFAIGCVAVATGVRIGIGLVSPDSTVFAPYYSATLVAALVGGATSGALASVLGAATAYWFFGPAEWANSPLMLEHVISLALYGSSSVVIIWAAESYRGLLQRIRKEENTRQLLNGELAHRIKNLLASVQAIVGQTLHDQQPEVMEKVRGRIAALGATNDLLIRSEWHGAWLREILEAEFAPFGLARFQISGDDVECPSDVAVWLALAIHELTTNAAKYGALCFPHGRIAVAWISAAGRLDLEWIESGGPAPQLPVRSGFGTKLLESGLRQFHGRLERRFEPVGLHCTLSLPLAPDEASPPLAPEGSSPPVRHEAADSRA